MKTKPKTKKTVRRKPLRVVSIKPIYPSAPWSYKVDPKVQAEYICVRPGKVSYTRELRNGLTIDLDAKGAILGIEILYTPRLTKKR